MNVDAWLRSATEDARQRGLEALIPLLETLARSTRALRAADESLRAQPQSASAQGPRDAR